MVGKNPHLRGSDPIIKKDIRGNSVETNKKPEQEITQFCDDCNGNFSEPSTTTISSKICAKCKDKRIDRLTLNQAKMLKNTNQTFAKHGFRGTVSMKTLFTVGEGGKKEYVTRKKSNNIFDMGGF